MAQPKTTAIVLDELLVCVVQWSVSWISCKQKANRACSSFNGGVVSPDSTTNDNSSIIECLWRI